jgi:hypothetical protein
MGTAAGGHPHLSEVQESLLGSATEGNRKEGLNIFIINVPLHITKEERAEPEKPRHQSQYQSQYQSQSKSQSKSKREPLNLGFCRYLKEQDATAAEISAYLEQKWVSGQLKIVLKKMIVQGLIEYSIPDKPRSHFQRYRLTTKDDEWLISDIKSGSSHEKGDNS